MVRSSVKTIKVLLAGCIVMLFSYVLTWGAYDQPHNQENAVDCGNCHYTNGAGSPPSWMTPGSGDNTVNNLRCTQCHTLHKTHSATNTDSNLWQAAGGWMVECVNCHNPHYQVQSKRWGPVSYIATGTVSAVGAWQTLTNDTVITLSAPLGAEFQGYYLIPNTAYRNFLYKIKTLTDGQSQVTVKGKVGTGTVFPKAGTGTPFAIVYARNIKDVISISNPGNVAVGSDTVKMFRQSGTRGPGDATTPGESICFVCHTLASPPATVADHQASGPCASCHAHDEGFKAACDSCHQYPPPTNAHRLHVTTLSFACDECHFGNIHNPAGLSTTPAQFLNVYDRTKVDVGFDPNGFNSDTNNGTDLGLPVYARNGSSLLATCANLTCHNPDNRFTGKGYSYSTNNIPAWGSVISTCTACHTTVGAADGARHSHERHENSSYSSRVDCTGCHAGINVIDPEIKGTDSRHANKVLNIDQSGNYPVKVNASLPQRTGITATYVDGAPGTTTGSTCSNVYCHGALPTGIGWNNTLTWGSSNVDSSGNCFFCHKYGTDMQYASNKSHFAHLDRVGTTFKNGPQLNEYSCTACHAESGGGSRHADGRVDLIGAADGATLADTTACDTCHGTAAGIAEAKANWHLNVSTSRHRITDCQYCHNSLAPANSKMDGTGVNAPPKDYFLSTGHGKSGTFNATGNSGPSYACTNCHDQDSKHINHLTKSEMRFRAVPADGLNYTTVSSEVCLDCHSPGKSSAGSLGKDAQSEATVHSGGVGDTYNTTASSVFPAYGNKDNYVVSPGYQCADCHDPHGTGKLAMIKPVLDGRLGGSSNPVSVTGFESSKNDLADLAPDATPGSGVCGSCHALSGSSHPDTLHPNNHHQGETGKSCMNCHTHKYNFGIAAASLQIIDTVGNTADRNLDFGSIVATAQKSLTITVRNAGHANLVLGAIASGDSLTAPFSIVSDVCSGQTLAPAATCTFSVRFAPPATGSFSDSFDVVSNDPAGPATITVNGTATASGPDITVTDSVAPHEDLAMTFGEKLISSSTDQTVTITNDGVSNLTLGALASADQLAAPFSIVNNTCTTGLTLVPGAACTFTVRFAPALKGFFSDHFDIPSDDPDENPLTFTVSGTGLNPVYAYIMSQGSSLNNYIGAVTKIRTFDNQIIQTLPTTSSHRHTYVAVIPDGSKIYTNYVGTDTLRIYTPSLTTQSVTLPASTSATYEAASQNGAYVYAIIYSYASPYTSYLSVIDTGSNSIIVQKALDVASQSYISGLAVSPDGAYVCVSVNAGAAHYVSVLRTLDLSVAMTINLESAYGIAFSADSSKMYIVNNTGNSVSVVRTSDFTVKTGIGVGPGPKNIVASPDGTKMYIVNETDNTISIIDATSDTLSGVIATMPSTGNLGSISITPDGKLLYVTVPAANQVIVIRTDVNMQTDSIAVASAPYSYGKFIQTDDPNLDQPDISLTDTVAPAGDHGVNFGNITVNQVSAIQTITVRNAGAAGLVIGNIAVQDPVTAPFSITSNTCGGQTLAPAATCTIGVRYSPTAAGVFYETFDIPSNDPNESVVRVTLKGTGTYPDIMVTDPVGLADDSLLPFGNQVMNTTATRIITVRNNGVGNLVFGSITAGAPFSIDLAASTCDNYGATGMTTGSTCTVYAQFTPTAQTVYTGAVSISSNDPNNSLFTVVVTGTGTAPAPDITLTDQNSANSPAVTSMDFGYQDYHAGSLTKTLYIRNDGSVVLNIGALSLPAGPFTVEGNTCTSLNPGGICSVTLKFAPAAGVAYDVTLSIASNDPDENPAVFTLTGHGFETYLAYVTNSFVKNPDSVCRFTSCVDANTVSPVYIGTNATTGSLTHANFGNAAVWDGVLNSDSVPFGVAATDSRIYITASGYNQVWHIPAKNTWTFSAAGKINVGSGPTGIAASPDGKRLYVANAFDNTVSVIDRATHTVTATINVGSYPRGVDVTPDSLYVYVANASSNTVSVISAADNAVVDTVTVGTAPFGVAVSPDGLRVFATNYSANTVSEIGTASNTVTRTISAGAAPYGIAITPDGNFVYVANATAATVTVIETAGGTVAATVNVAGAISSYPTGVAATPDGKYIYVVNSAGTASSTSLPGWITAIRTSDNTVVGTVNTDKGATGFGKFIISYHTPNIQVSSQSISFGHVVPGNSAAQTITITSNGPVNANLVIGNIGTINPLSAPFTVVNDTCSARTLASGATCTFDVRFSPGTAGSFADSFAIPNNDPEGNPITVTVSGVGNNLPATPVNFSPAAGASGVAISPILTASSFSDADGDTHLASQWRVSTAAGAGFDAAVVYDSGVVAAGNNHTVAATANFGTTYYWKVRYQDSQGDWSAYSGETAFATLTNATPAKPVNMSPVTGTVDVVRKPALTASVYSDGDAGDTHLASQWRISRGTGAAFDANSIYDSGTVAGATAHAVSANLPVNTLCFWKVRYQDSKGVWSAYSDESSFTTVKLLSQWHLDEGTGTTAADSGGSNTGGLTGTAYWTAGYAGNGLSCSGDDKLSWAYAEGRPANNFTLEAMVQVNAAHGTDTESTSGAGGISGKKYLFGANFYGSPDAGMGVSIGTNGISVYEHSGSYMPALAVYDATLSPLSGWNHVVVTYTGKQPRIYLNGSLVRTGLVSPRTNVYVSTSVCRDDASYGAFAGLVDEVRIYGSSLSDAEVLARCQAVGKCP